MNGINDGVNDTSALALPHADNDPEKIEVLYADVSASPDVREAEPAQPEPIVVPDAGHNRLITRTVTVQSTTDAPVQLLAADPTRVEVHVIARSATATDVAHIAGTAAASVFNTEALVLPVGVDVPLKDYTGALFVYPGLSITGPVYVSVTAVSK